MLHGDMKYILARWMGYKGTDTYDLSLSSPIFPVKDLKNALLKII